MSELKRVDSIYFQFLSYFYFILCLFLFWEPELVFGITQYHTSVTVTQSHVMIEDGRRV